MADQNKTTVTLHVKESDRPKPLVFEHEGTMLVSIHLAGAVLIFSRGTLVDLASALLDADKALEDAVDAMDPAPSYADVAAE